MSVAALLLASVSASLATGATERRTVVMRVTAEFTGQFVDHGRPIQRFRLLATGRQFGKTAGAIVGECELDFRYVNSRSMIVSGTSNLPDGTIRFRGVVRVVPSDHVRPLVVPVVGGSGRYADARGMYLGGVSEGLRQLTTYRLTLP
jgi:hypothetical protein